MTKEQIEKLFIASATYFPEYNEMAIFKENFIYVMQNMIPFEGFWNRLEMFVSNVQVHDMISEEEKQMILSVCKNHKPNTKASS
jgi:hypothetical protein